MIAQHILKPSLLLRLFCLSLSVAALPASAHIHDKHKHAEKHDKNHTGSSVSAVQAEAYYIANEGIMVSQKNNGKNLKVIFDPLFNNTYGQYQPLPERMRTKLISGQMPFDHVDAIFISHHHGDHFDPKDMLALLVGNPEIKLFAPKQAIAALRQEDETNILKNDNRIHTITLDYGDAPLTLMVDGLTVEAIRIPHAGGEGRRAIQNIVYRITLDEKTTIMHMGDADPDDVHYAPYEAHWKKRMTDTAFPPYWFFLSDEGNTILSKRLRIKHSIGSHVPEGMPDDPSKRNEKFQGYDLFTEPGETRTIKP